MPERAKILIVDDEPENREWLGDLVQRLGHVAVPAASGAEALAILGDEVIDVVLLDLRMPGLSGLDVLARLAALGLTPALPVVVVSGLLDRDTRIAALAGGATDFLHKPYDRHEVGARLQTLVALRRLHAQVAGHLRAAKDLHEALMAGAPVAITVADLTGRIVEVNAAAEAMFEPALRPLVGRLVIDVIVPEQVPEAVGAFARVAAGGPSETLTVRVPRRAGELDVETSASYVETEHGRFVILVGRDVTAERTTRRELAAREAELRRAQAMARIGSAHYDLGTTQRRWSDETFRILGLPLDAVVGPDSYLTNVHPDDRARLADEVAGWRVGGPPPQEHRMMVGGEVRWISTQFETETDAAGRPTAILATVHDITDRKLVGLALEDSLRFAREVLDSLAEHVAIVDERGDIIATNRAWRDGAVARGGSLAVTADGASYLAACEGTVEGAEIARGIRRAIAGAADVTEVEYRCDSPSEPRWYACRIRRFDGAGPPRVVVAHVDVSAVKRAQLESVEHAQRLALLVTNLPLVVWEGIVVDGAVQTRWVSANVERVLGVSADQLAGPDGWTAQVHPDDRAQLRSRTAGGAGAEQWLEQYRWVRPAGSVIHLQAGITTRPGADAATLILGFALDVTAAKQLEETLLQASKMDALGQLTGGIAHDFNNLLAVILSFAGFVHATVADGDALREDLDEVLRAANKGVDLIRQLLIFSHQQPQVKRPVDLNVSIVGLTKMLQRCVGEDVELIVTVSARPAVVYMDPVQIDQVIMNLAVNARAAMPGGGQLRLGIEHPVEAAGGFAPGQYVRIVVVDTGAGVDPATAARIFEPFFPTKGVGKGTGLGLATCYAIIRDGGGTIRVDSAPGRGTTFTLDLPSCALPVATAVASVTANLKVAGERVLVVEDDAALRKAAVGILGSAGYRVSEAHDGDDAIRWLAAARYQVDLIFTDVVMPGCGGYAVASHAKARAPGARVLLTSGYIDGRAAPSRDVESLPLLWKPYTPASLLHAVSDALAGSGPAGGLTMPPEARGPSSPAPAAGEVVLLIEDDALIRMALRRVLVGQGGYEVVTAESIEEATAALADGQDYAAVLCDLTLTDGSGADLVAWLRATRPALARRTIVLTGGVVDESGRRLVAEGHTEVLGKPTDPALLLARVAAAAARAPTAEPPTLPASERGRPTAAAVAGPTIASAAGPGRRGAVLLFEGDAPQRDRYANALRDAGFVVTAAASGSEAVALLDRQAFDAVVADIGQPDSEGLTLLRAAHARDPDLPVLLVTATPSAETAASAVKSRARGYLVKPFPIAHLIREVEQAVQLGAEARRQRERLHAPGGPAEPGAELADLAATRHHFEAALAGLRVVYQPIVRGHDHSVFGYEALLRSDEPTLATPPKVLAAAEVLGRTDDVGLVVRGAIAHTLGQHPGRHETIFANLHPRELRSALLGAPTEPLRRHARRIVLEVPERASLAMGPHLADELRRLRDAGYRIALDDLGAGSAGLAHLARLQPDIAKIDMSLVRDAPRSSIKRELLSSLVNVCRRAGITTVAEGVETAAEASLLTDLGYDLLQGYYFARPGPAFPEVLTRAKA